MEEENVVEENVVLVGGVEIGDDDSDYEEAINDEQSRKIAKMLHRWVCAVCLEAQAPSNLRDEHISVITSIMKDNTQRFELPDFDLDDEYFAQQTCVDCGRSAFYTSKTLKDYHHGGLTISNLEIFYDDLMIRLLQLRIASGLLLDATLQSAPSSTVELRDWLQLHGLSADKLVYRFFANNNDDNRITHIDNNNKHHHQQQRRRSSKVEIFTSGGMLAHCLPEHRRTKPTFVQGRDQLLLQQMRQRSIEPERPDRIRSIILLLFASGLWEQCHITLAPLQPPIKSREKTRKEKKKKKNMCEDGYKVTGDTYWGLHTLHATRIACNLSIDAIDRLTAPQGEGEEEGRTESAFVIVRPPGHHANAERSCGFCIVNNVAVATAHAIHNRGVERVMIIDWDVHHGDGTEVIFYDNPNVLFISLHRYGGFYPGTGHPHRVGEGRGSGFNANIAMDGKWSDDDDYLRAFEEIVIPLAREFDPQLVLISSGFDAAVGDPLGDFNISPWGYGEMTRMLVGLKRKIGVFLEGGYNLYSIGINSEIIVRTLLTGTNPITRAEGILLAAPALGGRMLQYQKLLKKERSNSPALSVDELNALLPPLEANPFNTQNFQDLSIYLSPYWKCMKERVDAMNASLKMPQ